MLKDIILMADSFSETYGLKLIDNITRIPEDFNFNTFNLSPDLIKKMSNWHSEYMPYTSMTLLELKPNMCEVEKLDLIGTEIIEELAKEMKNRLKCGLKYFSIIQDKVLINIEI